MQHSSTVFVFMRPQRLQVSLLTQYEDRHEGSGRDGHGGGHGRHPELQDKKHETLFRQGNYWWTEIRTEHALNSAEVRPRSEELVVHSRKLWKRWIRVDVLRLTSFSLFISFKSKQVNSCFSLLSSSSTIISPLLLRVIHLTLIRLLPRCCVA